MVCHSKIPIFIIIHIISLSAYLCVVLIIYYQLLTEMPTQY
jgi:hypothetical protein